MANVVPTRKFLKWLKKRGLIFISQEGSHKKFDYPTNKLKRPVIVKTNLKEIPEDHISTNLNTLGVSKKNFYEEIKKI